MRILGVTEYWPKLKKPRWSTFRLERRDWPWEVGEVVQVVYKTRSKEREVLGVAKIVEKEPKRFFEGQPGGAEITTQEAIEDGFISVGDMMLWMLKAHGSRVRREPLNKLTVEWAGGIP